VKTVLAYACECGCESLGVRVILWGPIPLVTSLASPPSARTGSGVMRGRRHVAPGMHKHTCQEAGLDLGTHTHTCLDSIARLFCGLSPSSSLSVCLRLLSLSLSLCLCLCLCLS
jgi:hypothetical protein